MKKNLASSLAALALLGLTSAVTPIHAATYYVDYKDGSDSNNGTTPGTAFKRSPGDNFATGAALATTLAAGDVVIFKGGVEYPVELILKWSGSPGNPIILDGNTAGTFGTGKAIFTGADHVTSWVPCTSSADAGGATDWQNCYKAVRSTPWSDDPFMVNLFYDGNRGVVARSPDAENPLYWDAADVDYAPLTTSEITDTTVTFPDGFSPDPLPGQTWPEAWVATRNTSNLITIRRVVSTSPDGEVLTLSKTSVPRDALNSFVLFNDGRLLTQRGEYILTEDSTYGPRTKIVFYAGPGGAAPLDALVSQKRNTGTLESRLGLDINEMSHYVVRGIIFTNYAGGMSGNARNGCGIANFSKTSARDTTDIVIRNCTVQNCQNLTKSGAIRFDTGTEITIDSCTIVENPGNRGITMSSSNSVISNNLVVRGGGTGIFTALADNVQIINNEIIDNSGLHGNGISVYNNSSNVLVARNYVIDSNFALTIQASSNVDVAYNVFKHPATETGPAVELYNNPDTQPESSNIRFRNNVILGETRKSFKVDPPFTAGLVVENNIIDGSVVPISKITTMNNNLFLSKYSASGGTYIGPTDHYVAGEPRPFVDEAAGDFRIVSTSWAVDNGVAWTFAGGDLAGSPIVGVRDVGAFEYLPSFVFGGGKGHSVALKDDGTIWTWGSNTKGQLGSGGAIPGTNTKVPGQLTTISGAIAVSGGFEHTVALMPDGTVWTWGANSYGQLGDGTTTDSSSPVQVASLTDVVSVASGSYHNLALKADGTLWAWGRNNLNQIMSGGGNKLTPVQLGITNVSGLAPGANHSIVLKTDNTVWGWGYNTSGQLGNGSTTNASSPVQVTGLSNIASVAAGGSHSVAISKTGTIYTWGQNTNGQLGDGTTTNRNTAYALTGLTNGAKAVCGLTYTKILTASGDVWGCGSNAQAQIGVGVTGGNYTSPVQITGLSGILDIGTGDHHGLHRRADGTVASVGYNLNGQLGDNSTTTRSTPVSAGTLDLDAD